MPLSFASVAVNEGGSMSSLSESCVSGEKRSTGVEPSLFGQINS